MSPSATFPSLGREGTWISQALPKNVPRCRIQGLTQGGSWKSVSSFSHVCAHAHGSGVPRGRDRGVPHSCHTHQLWQMSCAGRHSPRYILGPSALPRLSVTSLLAASGSGAVPSRAWVAGGPCVMPWATLFRGWPGVRGSRTFVSSAAQRAVGHGSVTRSTGTLGSVSLSLD